MKKIIKYMLYQIYVKQRLFIMEIVMMLVAFLVLQYSIINNYSVRLAEINTKSILEYDTERIYKLNLDLYIQNFTSSEMQNNLVSFFSQMEKVPGIEQCGEFWYIPKGEMNDSEYNQLFVSENLQKLCLNKSLPETNMSKDNQDARLCPVVVGNDLENIYPCGTVFYSTEYDINCIVVSILEKGSRWIAPQYSDLLYISLDECMIYPADYFYELYPHFICNGLNDAYIAVDNAEDISYITEYINQLAHDNNIVINDVIGLDKLFHIRTVNRRDVMGELVIMPIILFAISVFTIVLTCIISVKKNIRDYGIMLSNGMSVMDISAMYFIENTIKINIAFWLAYLYWYFNIKSSFNYMFYALEDITGIMLICLAVFIVLLNIVPEIILRRIRPVEMIGRIYY